MNDPNRAGQRLKLNMELARANVDTQAAIDRVMEAGVRASPDVIKCFVQNAGADSIMAASLAEIRDVANAF